jgi:hypothetical protein
MRLRDLSDAQRHAIGLLSFAVPLHYTFISWSGVRGPTLTSLERLGLVRRVSLFEEGRSIPIPFYTLTQAGEKLRGRAPRPWVLAA